MEETPARRSRGAALSRPRYRAVVLLTYPATEAAAEGRKAGQREHPWAKALPGDIVPDWVVRQSPGLLAKGRVEMVYVEGEEG